LVRAVMGVSFRFLSFASQLTFFKPGDDSV